MRRALCLALLAACGSVDENRHLDGGSDGPTPDTPDARVPTCWGQAFSAPAPVASLNSAAPDIDLRLAPDELTAYFSRVGSAAPTMGYVATRASATAPFGAPSSMTLGTSAELYSPSVTADGLTIYFTSSRTGTLGMSDVWKATRATTTASFGSVANVTELNSTATESDVYVVPDGSAIYFSSDRNTAGIHSIFRAANAGATFAAPTVVLTDTANLIVNRVVVSPDELTMFYQRGNEIYETRRAAKTDSFTLATTPLATINSVNADHPTWISPDGCRLYLETDRQGTQALDFFVAVRTPQ